MNNPTLSCTPAGYPRSRRTTIRFWHYTRPGRALGRTVGELQSLNRTRRNLFRLELALRGIPHDGDPKCTPVSVLIDGLWFPVSPWFRDRGRWVWMVDHPYRDLDDPVLERDIVIGYHYGGLRMDLTALPRIWREYADKLDAED
ncbi:hypothetical protein [Nocardia salmonicida]|uniref:hypothetical protein n=1 Tax=Nocardia salmonicida TaxID=53431 RepID=UPI0037B6CB13